MLKKSSSDKNKIPKRRLSEFRKKYKWSIKILYNLKQKILQKLMNRKICENFYMNSRY